MITTAWRVDHAMTATLTLPIAYAIRATARHGQSTARKARGYYEQEAQASTAYPILSRGTR